MYVFIALILLPSGGATYFYAAKDNWRAAIHYNGINVVVMFIWACGQLWLLFVALQRIEKIIKQHNDCLKDTFVTIKVNLFIFGLSTVFLGLQMIASFQNNFKFYLVALLGRYITEEVTGLVLLHLINKFNESEVSKQGTPSLMHALRIKRTLEKQLADPETKREALRTYMELSENLAQESFISAEERQNAE